MLKNFRKIAAERITTVNGLVRDFLENLAGENRKREKVPKDLLKLTPSIKTRVGKIRWTREELHAR